MVKTAFITGITGQDGSYMAELLLSKGYEVHGLIRRSSSINTRRIDHLYVDPHEKSARLFLHYGDLSSHSRLSALISDIEPDEIYHLGAQSHVQVSFEMPEYTVDVTGLATVRLLEVVRQSKASPRFYNAGSSEMFGDAKPPQSESTPFSPRSPYAVAKAASAWTTKIYREGYNLFACTGILFNHESPRRGETFVTRKITRAIASILAGEQETLYLGNLDATRDWGYAPEYVEAMWLMLQQDSPEDFVIGTGKSHSIRDFLKTAFEYAGLNWGTYVKFDPRYVRPLEVDDLQADYTRASEVLGWSPKVSFDDLVQIMVDADLEALGVDFPGLGKKFVESGVLMWHEWNNNSPVPATRAR